MFVFTGLGFGLYGQLARHQLYYVVGRIWVFQLIDKPDLARDTIRFGPARVAVAHAHKPASGSRCGVWRGRATALHSIAPAA